MTQAPITPYPDDEGRSSGWSGSQTSKARAHRRDASGATVRLQTRLLVTVTGRGWLGLTVAEARRAYAPEHHGSISGALSNLHKAEKIACLIETRDGCHIYVTPDRVDGRATRSQGKGNT